MLHFIVNVWNKSQNFFSKSVSLNKCLFSKQKQNVSESTEEKTKSAKTMQGKRPELSAAFFSSTITFIFPNISLFIETLDKLSRKEEECTSLTTESETLRSQLAGENS